MKDGLTKVVDALFLLVKLLIVKVHSFFWGRYHKYMTGFTPIEVCDMYVQLLGHFAEQLSSLELNISTDRFVFATTTVRLAGSTLVINETWSLNYTSPKAMYVHFRQTRNSEWELVYRTNRLMKDTKFIEKLDGAFRCRHAFVPIVETVENAGNPTNCALVN